ncbi:MAG: carboxypeptidase-like regulatory domain-containing protein [Acidobacteriota bacterium]
MLPCPLFPSSSAGRRLVSDRPAPRFPNQDPPAGLPRRSRALLRFGLSIVFVVLLALAAIPAAAQNLEVTGRVLGPDGGPVAGAALALVPREGSFDRAGRLLDGTLLPDAVATALTDRSGTFRLDAPAGVYTLRLDADGLLPLETRLEPLVESLELPDAELERDVGASIRVQDASGKALSGVWVLARTAPSQRRFDRSRFGLETWRPGRQVVQTDEDGAVALTRGAEDSLSVRVYAAGHVEGEAKDVKGRRTIRLDAAEERRIEVRDARGRPVEGAMVRVGGWSFPVGISDATGGMTVHGAPGERTKLVVETEDRRRYQGGFTVPKAPNRRPASAEVVVLPDLVTLDGRVTDAETRSGMAGAFVWISGYPETLVRSGRSGGFRVSGAAGARSLSAAAPGYFPAQERLKRSSDGTLPSPLLALAPAVAVEGRVVDAAGAPLEGVEVEASVRFGAAMRSRSARSAHLSGGGTRTDARGNFRLRELAPGAPYDISLALKGFAPGKESLVAPAVGDRADAVEWTLVRGRQGVGSVMDEREAPVAGAEVSLTPQAPGDLRTQIRRMTGEVEEPAHQATTDAEGRYRLPDLGAGRFSLKVRATGFAPVEVPGVEVPPLEIGGDPDVDLGQVVLSPGATVAGKVTDDEGRPLAGAKVEATAPGSGYLRFATDGSGQEVITGADGRFEVPDRKAGERIDLVASKEGFVTARTSGIEAPNAEDVVLVLGPASTVSGRVVDEAGDGVTRARVSLQDEGASSGPGFSRRGPSAWTDPEGFFRVEGLEPGIRRLRVQGEGFIPAERAGIEISKGVDLEGVEVVLKRGATVSGRVTAKGGDPVPEAMIRVASAGGRSMGRAGFLNSARTDADGRYQLGGVEPGRRTLEVYHSEFGRAAETLEVRADAGNRQDFTLGAQGTTVSGVVIDPDGSPLPGANLSLVPSAAARASGVAGLSDAEGRFEIEGVRDGQYRLLAAHADFAVSESEDPIEVAGSPISGVVVRARGGTVLGGQITGLDFDQLSDLSVIAMSMTLRDHKTAAVDFEGKYRVEQLAPGRWKVMASAPDGRQVQEEIDIAEGAAEETLDLEFGGGLTLEGRVTLRGQPIDGGSIFLRGASQESGAGGTTDHRGQFSIDGLEAGTYDLVVYEPSSGLRHNQSVEVPAGGPVEVALDPSRVAGRVLTASGTGIPGAAIRARRLGVDPDDELSAWMRPESRSDDVGIWSLSGLSEGTWRISAEKDGYGQSAVDVELRNGQVREGVDLVLNTTEGLWLSVRRSGGQLPRSVMVAVLDGAGTPLSISNHAVDSQGQVHVSTVPPGTWTVMLSSAGLATSSLQVEVPAGRPSVVLADEAVLRIQVPDLRADGRTAKAHLTSGDGRRFQTIGNFTSLQSSFDVRGGEAMVGRLPAGSWTVTVTASGGEIWTATAVVAPGQTQAVEVD